MSIVAGIDPGGRSTGLVVRDGSRLLWHAVIDEPGSSGGLPSLRYLDMVLGTLSALKMEYAPAVWAMETVTPPRGFKDGKRAPIQPGSLIGVSAVAGAILYRLRDVVLIPPTGNGSKPLSTYPPDLIGPREKTGTGRLRHARSAWDVAGATRFTITPVKEPS